MVRVIGYSRLLSTPGFTLAIGICKEDNTIRGVRERSRASNICSASSNLIDDHALNIYTASVR